MPPGFLNKSRAHFRKALRKVVNAILLKNDFKRLVISPSIGQELGDLFEHLM